VVPGEHHVARDDGLLRDAWPAGQSQPTGELALVAAGGRPGEVGVLGVLRDHPTEGTDVLQRTAHHPRVVHALAVVGEHPHLGPRACHQAELSELLSAEASGDRTDWLYVDEPSRPTEVEHPLRRFAGVGDRRGVRHRQHSSEPTEGRGLRPGEHRLGVLAARLAQVRVQVDQAGERDQPVGVDHFGA
jgi:hypothetical protein